MRLAREERFLYCAGRQSRNVTARKKRLAPVGMTVARANSADFEPAAQHVQEFFPFVIRLAGRGVGDFTEDGGAACACGGGDVGRALVECFVGEDGEGQGFFGVGGDVAG